MAKNLLHLSGITEAPRAVRSKMDTILITPDIIAEWATPFCQRPLRVNNKVRSIAEEMRLNGNVVSGVITLGTIGGKPKPVYLLDGQHRCEAVKMSGIDEAIADVRMCDYDSDADMGEDWIKLQTSIVKTTPDDVLHALERSTETIALIKSRCDFVGYANIRRTPTSAMLSMAVALKCWQAARNESGVAKAIGASAMAKELTKDEAVHLVDFLLIAREAWGNDLEYSRLWALLNLTMTMWMFRRMVLYPPVKGGRMAYPHDAMNREQFRKCLMSLSASSSYLDWLGGRTLSERDRAPCMARIKAIFSRRVLDDTAKKIRLPKPEWSSR